MWKRSTGMLALGAAILLVAAACSSPSSVGEDLQPTGDGGSSQTTADSSGTQDSSAGEDGSIEVAVTLSEFAVEISQTEFQAGVEYSFTVVNDGAIEHEMMLMAPLDEGAEVDMDKLDEMAIAVFQADDLPPGGTETKTVVFPESGEVNLEAACRLPGHYEAGMTLPISVTS